MQETDEFLARVFPDGPPPAGELRFELTTSHAFHDPAATVVLCEQTLAPGRRIGALTILPTVALSDAAVGLENLLAGRFDRTLRPWRLADRNPWPAIDLFPALTRLAGHARAWLDQRAAR